MKKNLIALICTLANFCFASSSSYYVFAKSGLNLRTEANTSAKVLTTVAYGEEVNMLVDYVAEITLDHLKGYWVKVQYKTFKGYLVNTYLLPHKAPVGVLGNIDQYISQLTTVAYKTETFRSFGEGLEVDRNVQKTFYRNGMELHYSEGSESTEHTYFFPFWKKENAFLLLKSFTEFKILNEFGVEYPTGTKVYKKGERTLNVRVLKEGESFLIYYMGESITTITVMAQWNQIVITISKEA